VTGGRYNTWDATSYYQYGALGQQVYDQPGWVKYGCSTYPLDKSSTPTGTTTFGTAKYGNNVANDTTKTLG
jgi:hypothetical protein